MGLRVLVASLPPPFAEDAWDGDGADAGTDCAIIAPLTLAEPRSPADANPRAPGAMAEEADEGDVCLVEPRPRVLVAPRPLRRLRRG